MKLGYLGIDREGNRYKLLKHPRQELLDQLGRAHADNIYIDSKTGTKHIGYLIAGHQITVYEVHEWDGMKRGA